MIRTAGVGVLLLALCACGGDDDTLTLPVDLTPESMFIDGKCMAWDGEAFAVAWIGRVGDIGDMYWARVSPEGAVLSGPDRLNQGLESRIDTCDLFYQDDRYLLVYITDDGTSYSFEFFANGSTQGSPTEVYSSSYEQALTMRDGSLSVLRQSSGSIDGATQYYYRVQDSAISDPPTIAPSTARKYDPTVAWSANEGVYLAAWRRSDRIRFARIDPDGAFAGTEDRYADSGSDQYDPVLLPVGDGTMWIAWMENGQWSFMPGDTNGIGAWTENKALLPGNRAATQQLTMGQVPSGDSYVIWRGDHETSLAQIYAAKLDSAAESITDIELLSDPRYEYRRPVATAGPDGIAILFEGEVAGSERVFWSRPGATTALPSSE